MKSIPHRLLRAGCAAALGLTLYAQSQAQVPVSPQPAPAPDSAAVPATRGPVVVSGVVLWWPRGRPVAVYRVRGRPAHRMWWRDLHAVTGLFAGGVIVRPDSWPGVSVQLPLPLFVPASPVRSFSASIASR